MMNKEETIDNMIIYVLTLEHDAIADEKLAPKVVDKILAELEREFKQ